MHVLYVHPNFPAQFGHIAAHVVKQLGWRATFVSQTAGGAVAGVEKIQYQVRGGATAQNHFCSRTFENAIWHTDAVYEALKSRPDVQPDLIVGHSGFGSTLFLRELYGDTPIVNLFEYYYRPTGVDSDMQFRQDLGWPLEHRHLQRARSRNAMILLDLQNCDTGYTPTRFQRSRFPWEYDAKLRVIFDGIDRALYHGHGESLRPSPETRGERTVAGHTIPSDVRVVTYVSRGFESMRGFDMFLRAAKRISQECPNVLFFVVGSDRICYGGDEDHIEGHKDFKSWAIARESPDLSRFVFTGAIPPGQLARLLALSDLHIYLTVPFVLSWSMMDAMSCGAVVLGSATSPVMEMIEHERNGLLADFFDADAIAAQAVRVLRDPGAFRPLGRAAEEMIESQYSMNAVVPGMVKLYEHALGGSPRAQ